MLFTKGAESAILPFTTSGEIEKTRLHVDEFALVRFYFTKMCMLSQVFQPLALLLLYNTFIQRVLVCKPTSHLLQRF